MTAPAKSSSPKVIVNPSSAEQSTEKRLRLSSTNHTKNFTVVFIRIHHAQSLTHMACRYLNVLVYCLYRKGNCIITSSRKRQLATLSSNLCGVKEESPVYFHSSKPPYLTWNQCGDCGGASGFFSGVEGVLSEQTSRSRSMTTAAWALSIFPLPLKVPLLSTPESIPIL